MLHDLFMETEILDQLAEQKALVCGNESFM